MFQKNKCWYRFYFSCKLFHVRVISHSLKRKWWRKIQVVAVNLLMLIFLGIYKDDPNSSFLEAGACSLNFISGQQCSGIILCSRKNKCWYRFYFSFKLFHVRVISHSLKRKWWRKIQVVAVNLLMLIFLGIYKDDPNSSFLEAGACSLNFISGQQCSGIILCSRKNKCWYRFYFSFKLFHVRVISHSLKRKWWRKIRLVVVNFWC